jgi:hypothetical protein
MSGPPDGASALALDYLFPKGRGDHASDHRAMSSLYRLHFVSSRILVLIPGGAEEVAKMFPRSFGLSFVHRASSVCSLYLEE